MASEDSVHSYVTDTVSIPDQETLNAENVNDCDDILAQISQDPGGSKDHEDNIIFQLGDVVNKMWSTTWPKKGI